MKQLPFLLLLPLLVACAHHPVQSGAASWYGRELRGHPTASGVPFRPCRRTAAHRELPFGTVVRVTRPDTGKSVKVLINDRGPFVKGRIIDLSRRSARRIDLLDVGVASVEIKVLRCRRGWEDCEEALDALIKEGWPGTAQVSRRGNTWGPFFALGGMGGREAGQAMGDSLR